jgi:hypothetical protein
VGCAGDLNYRIDGNWAAVDALLEQARHRPDGLAIMRANDQLKRWGRGRGRLSSPRPRAGIRRFLPVP